MSWRVEYTKAALKQLKKMDRFDARLILSWIEKNLEGCDDPAYMARGLRPIEGASGDIVLAIIESCASSRTISLS